MNSTIYFFTVAYKGTAYHGWQRQPNAISVQQKIEEVFSTIFNEPLEILGSGRTDAGVHAKGQVFQLALEADLNVDNLIFRANKMLPSDIAIAEYRRVIPTAHARFDATSRSYEYLISKDKNPFGPDLVYNFRYELDYKKMNEAAALLKKYVDFESFSKVKTDVFTFNCEIFEAEWRRSTEQVNEEWVFHVSANRFLRGMVRALVGTLLEVGLGRMGVEDFEQVIVAKDRNAAGRSAPAHGLFLTAVKYPASIYLQD